MARPERWLDLFAIDRRLVLIWKRQHHGFCRIYRFSHVQNQQILCLGTRTRPAVRPQPNHNINIRIPKIQRMGMTLTPVTENSNLFPPQLISRNVFFIKNLVIHNPIHFVHECFREPSRSHLFEISLQLARRLDTWKLHRGTYQPWPGRLASAQ